jgi:hypothetical protein
VAGRASLGALLTRAKTADARACAPANRKTLPAECSDAFGAAMFSIEEKQ